MPPKASKKTTAAPATPVKAIKKEEAPSVATPRKRTPAKKPTKEDKIFTQLAKEVGQLIPIDVSYEGDNVQSKSATPGVYTHSIKVEAPGSFSLTKTIVLTEGEYKGQQAILLVPAAPFRFMDLKDDIRVRIYGFYFAPQEIVGANIGIEGRRTENKEMYAKAYSFGCKNRVGLLAVNKEINQQATPILYNHAFQFEHTSALADFLSSASQSCRSRIVKVVIDTWHKTTARNALNLLAESRNLQSLKILDNVYAEADSIKAAKQFYTDAFRLLEALKMAKGNKDDALAVIKFGPKALTWKDDKKNAQPWDKAIKAEFIDELKKKMK